jgi:hypothetical protein
MAEVIKQTRRKKDAHFASRSNLLAVKLRAVPV